MPLSAVDKIKRLPGVTRVCARAVFYGSYQDPKNGVFALATDAEDWLAVRPEYSMAAEQLQAFKGTRAAIRLAAGPEGRRDIEDKISDRMKGFAVSYSVEWIDSATGCDTSGKR